MEDHDFLNHFPPCPNKWKTSYQLIFLKGGVLTVIILLSVMNVHKVLIFEYYFPIRSVGFTGLGFGTGGATGTDG